MRKTLYSLLAMLLALLASTIAAFAINENQKVAQGAQSTVCETQPAQPAECEHQKTACEMAAEMIQNEKDERVRNAFVDIIRGFTEEPERTQNQYTVIGEYPAEPNLYDIIQMHAMIGTNTVGYTTISSAGTYKLMVATQDSQQMQTNREDVQMLYSICMQARNDTANMNDMEKINYVVQTVNTLIPEYSQETYDTHYATWAIKNKKGCCSAYASLTYLIGLNSGLDVDLISGVIKSTNGHHAWNKVYVNNEVYVVDTVQTKYGQSVFTQEEYNTRFQECVKTNDAYQTFEELRKTTM